MAGGGSAITAGAQFFNAYAQSENIRQQGIINQANAEFQATQNEINARFAEIKATEIIEQGNEEAQEYQKRVRQTVGSQRATLAAQGIVVDSDTALDLQTEAAEIGALDVETIKNNAWRQAFGYKQEAVSQRFQAAQTRATGKFNKTQSQFAARQTLVAGGMQAAGTATSAMYKAGG